MWRMAESDLIVTAIPEGKLLRVDVGAGTTTVFAEVGGGPNGAYPCADGGVVVANNGGLDWQAIGVRTSDPAQPTTPGLQRVYSDGHVELLTAGYGPFTTPTICASGRRGRVVHRPAPVPAPPEPTGQCGGGRRVAGRPCRGRFQILQRHRCAGRRHGDHSRTQRAHAVAGPVVVCGDYAEWGDGFAFDIERQCVRCQGSISDRDVAIGGGSRAARDAGRGPGDDDRLLLRRRRSYVRCCATEGRRGRMVAFSMHMPVAGRPMVSLSF